LFSSNDSKDEESQQLEEYYEALVEFESDCIELVYTEIDRNTTGEENKEDIKKLLSAMTEFFDPEEMISSFRYYWSMVLLTPDLLHDYMEKVEKHDNHDHHKSASKSWLKNIQDQVMSASNIERVDINHLVWGKTSEEKDQFSKFVAKHYLHDKEEIIEVAFSYHVVLETLAEYAFSPVFSAIANKHAAQKWSTCWRVRDKNSNNLLTEYEVQAFPKFFGRIEIIGKEGALQRIYFPLTQECREQMKNPLVKQEMESLQENVNRDSAEEKLDDFLDRSAAIQQVIKHQHRILTVSRFKTFIRFLTMNESLWVFTCLFLTLMINFILLLHCNSDPDHPENQDYLDDHWYNIAKSVGGIHLAAAFILVINYSIGTAQVTINRGWKWKEMVQQGLVPLNPAFSVVFNTACALAPAYVWTLFFLIGDFLTFYYIMYLIFSILGNTVSLSFFCFHVLDIAVRIKLLNYVVKSVTVNIGQVLATLLLGLLLVYIYAVLAFSKWGWAQYEFGDGGGGWTSLYTLFWQHIDYGFRGPPIMDSSVEMDEARYLFDISYNILIILIMVAIITGIIIDTFADMRAAKNDIEQDINNVCFICSLPREAFERHQIVFEEHLNSDHNVWNYIFYKMYIDQKKETELTGVETYLKDLMVQQKISYFPISKAMALQEEEDGEGELDELKEKVDNLEVKLTELFKEELQKLHEALKVPQTVSLTNNALVPVSVVAPAVPALKSVASATYPSSPVKQTR